MRAVFTCQRVETAEGVAALLRTAGIAVCLRNGRSYHSRRSGQFSFSEDANREAFPTVWVCDLRDQIRARRVLRQALLLETTRPESESASLVAGHIPSAGAPSRWRGAGLRMGLIGAALAGAACILLSHRSEQRVSCTQPPTRAFSSKKPAATKSTVHQVVRVHLHPASAPAHPSFDSQAPSAHPR